MRDEKCCLSYWYPKLLTAGVPTPETRIIKTDSLLHMLLDGKKPDGYDTLCENIRDAAYEIIGDSPLSPSIFLRTGMTSGKHDWSKTCCVNDLRIEFIQRHVTALVEYSELADFLGIPTNVWVVREFIEMDSSFTAFDGFPVNRERRYFITDGGVSCHHPYWPKMSILRPSVKDWERRLELLNAESHQEIDFLIEQSERVAAVFKDDGAWSVDWALGKNGIWYCIDMAEAHRSFHWEGCQFAAEPEKA